MSPSRKWVRPRFDLENLFHNCIIYAAVLPDSLHIVIFIELELVGLKETRRVLSHLFPLGGFEFKKF